MNAGREDHVLEQEKYAIEQIENANKTEKDLEVNFFLQFGWNNKIYNTCKPIIFKYNILNIA